MKKIILALLLTVGIYANPYIGFVGMLTDKTEDCRVYAGPIIGYQVNEKFAVEGRYTHILRGDQQWASAYAKVQISKDFYGLVGWEKSLTVDDYASLNGGIGWQKNNFFMEALYRKDAETLAANIGFRF